MTDYELGVFRLYSFKVHGILDYVAASTSTALPAMLGFTNKREAAYFYAQGGGESLIAGLPNYDDDSGGERPGQRLDDRARLKMSHKANRERKMAIRRGIRIASSVQGASSTET